MFFKYRKINWSALHISNGWLNCYTSVKGVFSNAAIKHLVQPDLITHRFSPGEPSPKPHRGRLCYHSLSLFFSSSLYFSLSIWVSSCWPEGLCGQVGPHWTTSEPIPKPHQASRVINGCISLSLLSLSLFIETSSLSVLVTWSVCVAALVEADSVLVNGRKVIC